MMTKTKSLSEMDLETFREMFREVGDLSEGWAIFELWNMISSSKKTLLLKGENYINIGGFIGTVNLSPELELHVIANNLFLYYRFSDTVLICSAKKNVDTIREFSSLFQRTLNQAEGILRESFEQGITFKTEIHDTSLGSANELLNVKREDYCLYELALASEELNERINHLLSDYLYSKVIELYLKKHYEAKYQEIQETKEKYYETCKQIIEETFVATKGMSDKEANAFDYDSLFHKLLKEGGLYP